MIENILVDDPRMKNMDIVELKFSDVVNLNLPTKYISGLTYGSAFKSVFLKDKHGDLWIRYFVLSTPPLAKIKLISKGYFNEET